MHHLRLRTPDWTQRHNPLATKSLRESIRQGSTAITARRVTRSSRFSSSSEPRAWLLRSLELLELEVIKLPGLVRQASRDGAELRTCDWMQRLKPLSTMRTRQPPHKAVMSMPKCITCDLALVTGRNVTSHCRQSPYGKAKRHKLHTE